MFVFVFIIHININIHMHIRINIDIDQIAACSYCTEHGNARTAKLPAIRLILLLDYTNTKGFI